MKYFSKNKKWMAYLILLTFLFTSIMPTNLATGDSMAYAAENDSIAFKRYSQASDKENVYNHTKKRNVVKFVVDCVKSDGKILDTLPAGSTLLDEITINSTVVDITSATFAGNKIPGYTFDDAYCYFYWNGDQPANFEDGNPVAASSFKNYGRISDRYSSYTSYIGWQSDEKDETADWIRTASERDPAYWAYNPTGTLHVVFKEVAVNNPYKTIYISNGTTIGMFEDSTTDKSWDGDILLLKPVNKLSEYNKAYMEALRPGYTFLGWCTTKDPSTGNGTGEPVTDAFFNTYVNSDIELYAKWALGEVQYNVEYYYQNDTGVYPNNATKSVPREATTGTTVSVTEEDKNPQGDYYFDANNANNILTDTIAADGSTVLKVYFAKQKNLTITAGSDTKEYDGTALTENSYTNTELKKGHRIESVTVTGSQIVVGSSFNVPSNAKIVDGTGKDVTEEYKITYVKGTLEVTPKAVTVTADNKSKVYGTADPALTATVAGTLGSDTVVYSLSRVAGENVGTYAITPAGEAVQGNYSVSYVPGTLTITQATPSEELTAAPYNGVYDAQAHGISVSGTVAGDVVYYRVNGGEWTTTAPTRTDVQEAETISVKAENPNYVTRYANATITITPRPATITVADASKVVGEHDPAITGKVEGLVAEGDLGEISYTRINNAETVGTYADVLTARYTENVNYTVTVIPGDFTITPKEDTEYVVEYWYQNPKTGEYELFETSDTRTTTAGSLAFITEEDTVAKQFMTDKETGTTISVYQFNAEKSITQKTVAVDGTTVLTVVFDALYNVVYRYTDGTATHDVASSGYVYGFEDKVIAPGMQSIDQFDGKWYKDEAITDDWVFAKDTINGNIALVDDANTIYLYTKAQVAPLDSNTIRVEKKAVNAPDGDVTYLFNLQLIVDTPEVSAPLTGDAATTLHRYNAAKITAEGEYKDALAALADAEKAFKNTVFRTTNSSLDFIMYGDEVEDINGRDIRPALFAINTTGSAYEYVTTPSVYEYNLFENSFDVVPADYNSSVDGSIKQQIIDFIKGLVNWRTPLQTLDPEMALYGLQAAGVNTSGSALAFEYEAASDLFLAAKDLIGKEAAYEEAKEALNNYMASVGRIAVLTVNGEQFILNEKDADGNYIYAQDKNGNFIWSRDFGLKNGMFEDFTVEVSTGSSVQFIITETYDGGADVTKVNGVTTHSVYSLVTTGSTYLFENIFEEEGGGGYTPEPPEKPEPPKDPEEIIDDPEVPLDEPDVPEEPVIEPGEEIPEPEVPLGDAPRTGDTNNAVPFMALMLFAMAGLAVTRRRFN